MDFAIFAIVFNIGKMYNKSKNTPKKQEKSNYFDKNQSFCVLVIKLSTIEKIKPDNLTKIAA